MSLADSSSSNGLLNSFSALAITRSAVRLPPALPFHNRYSNSLLICQQQRFRWTKAKKKRFYRYDRVSFSRRIPLTRDHPNTSR
jgi:hypothetical protein